MADNQTQTIPPAQPTTPMWTAPQMYPAQPTSQAYHQPSGEIQPVPVTFAVPQEQLGPVTPVKSGGRTGGFVEKLRTPVAAAVIGGVLLLGVGFATGYVVGHDRGASSSSSTTDGQTGFPGGQGGFGGQMPGQSQNGQSQNGQGQTGQGQSGIGQDQSQQFGQDQSQGWTPGGTQDGTTTQDGTDLSQTQ